MRLAVSIAAWSQAPDAVLRQARQQQQQSVPSALEALGFSVLHASLAELRAGLKGALAGVEPNDTLLLHVSGVLGAEGSLAVGATDVVSLRLVADALATVACARALVFVEGAYRGEEDAMQAVEHVEAIANALSSHAGSHTTVVAVHALNVDAAKLTFSHAILDAARDVVRPDGSALIEDAYTRARERQMTSSAGGFAFLRGGTAFPIARALAVVSVPAVTEPVLPNPSSVAITLAKPESAAPVTLRPLSSQAAASGPISSKPAPSRAASSRAVPSPAVSPPPGAVRSSALPPPPPKAASAAPPSVRAEEASPPSEASLASTSASPVWTEPSVVPAAAVPSPAVPAAAVPPPASTPLPSVIIAPVSAPTASYPADSFPAGSFPPVSVPAAPTVSTPSTLTAGRAGSSANWIEVSDVIEASPREQLDARIVSAIAGGDYELVVKLCRSRLALLTTAEARVDELFEIGRTLAGKLRDLPEAVIALEEARAIDPKREDVLEALRRAYARLERWTEALEATLALVKRTQDPQERAGLRVAAALLACKHLSDDEYALELLTAALGDDPADGSALEELVRIRRSRGELVDLEQTLAALANRLVEIGDAARAWDACQRLATLRRDDLGDTAGAVEALAIAKRLPLSELDSRAVLAEQLVALNDDEGAIAELEAIVGAAPEHVRAHARLFSIHLRTGNHDRAYLTALVLEELGHADATAREVLEAYRNDWGLRARSVLDDVAWGQLRASGSDEVIEAVFRASLRAAMAAQLEDRGKRPVLDPARRQSETSTASIVRCFTWAARALGAPCPALYVLDEVTGGIAAVSAPEPTTALGPDVLRGLSSRTLAFLAGRHITYFRPEYQVLVHFPTAESAAGLFFAAVEIVAPGTFVPPNLALRVASAKHRLARHLRADELAALSAAVGRMEARDARIDLIGWIRSVELTAGRAGLVLAGDLQTALHQVRTEARGLSGLSIEERRADLLAFCGSRALADLRSAYADTSPASMRPPPSSMRPPTTDSAVVRMDDPSLRDPGDGRTNARLMA